MNQKVYELQWEVEVLEKLLEEKVYPQIEKGSKVKITGAVSENIKVLKYGVLAETLNKCFLSDHAPVLVKVSL